MEVRLHIYIYDLDECSLMVLVLRVKIENDTSLISDLLLLINI